MSEGHIEINLNELTYRELTDLRRGISWAESEIQEFNECAAYGITVDMTDLVDAFHGIAELLERDAVKIMKKKGGDKL